MQAVTNAILNTIFVCIPEEMSLVLMSLILLKFDELLDIRMWRHNLKWIMIGTLPTAIMINILRYIIVVPRDTMAIISVTILIISMLYIITKNSSTIDIILILKTIFFTIVSFAMLVIMEELYVPLLYALTHMPTSYYNANIFYNFLIGTPARVLYWCIVAFIVMKKNSTVQVNLFNIIIKDKLFTGSFSIIIIGIVLAISYLGKLVHVSYILMNLKFIEQVGIVIMITTIPVLLITWLLVFINYVLSKSKQKLQVYENIINQDNNNITEDEDGYY